MATLPLAPCLFLLPFPGMMLNGTSSVPNGSVLQVAAPGRTERAIVVFYTGVIGSGAICPVLYGAFSDAFGIHARRSQQR